MWRSTPIASGPGGSLGHGYDDIVAGPPMKVAFLIERLAPARGGMERSVVDFVTELAAMGVEAHVVTQSAAEKFPGIQIHALGCEGWTNEMQYRPFVTCAERFLSGQRWDVGHAIRPCLSCDVYQPRGGLVKTGQDRAIAARPTLLQKVLRKIGLLFDRKGRLLTSLEQRLLTRKDPPGVNGGGMDWPDGAICSWSMLPMASTSASAAATGQR